MRDDAVAEEAIAAKACALDGALMCCQAIAFRSLLEHRGAKYSTHRQSNGRFNVREYLASFVMRIFLSAVSSQFKDARDALASDLRAVGAEVVVQEDFQQHGGTLLEKLESYIASCDRVVALVGDAYGWEPEGSGKPENRPRRSYSHWEYFFARGERLSAEPREPKDLYVYFASADFLASHPIEQDFDATQLQRDFIAHLRESGKDWNQFGSLDQLRALVLRDGFRVQGAGYAEAIQGVVSTHNFQRASREHPRLTATLKKRLRPLVERHNLFGGRTAELAAIAQYAQEHASGYIFVTGRSGFGKTALLAHLVKMLHDREENVCYHFISRRDQTADEAFTFRNLCQQLAAYHDLTGELPIDKEQLRVLYADLLGLPPIAEGERLFVVLDGLDEALGWTPASDMFPQRLPAGVFVVFSARQMAERDWLGELELGGLEPERLELEVFDNREIVMLLRAAEKHEWAEDEEFVALMHRKSGGDPFYLNYLVMDISKGLIVSREDLNKQPTGLAGYLNKWWEEVSEATGDIAVRDLLGYLLVSKGKLIRDELVNISTEDALDDWVFDKTMRNVERYLIGDATAGYALAHQRFQDFVAEEKIKGPAQLPYRQRLLSYCRRWRENRSRYAFDHLTQHLAEDGLIDDLDALVAEGGEHIDWAEARFEVDGSYDGFLRDLEIAWAQSRHLGPDALGRQLRYMLIESSVRTLSANIPADLLAELIPDLWSPARALAHVRQIPEESKRSESLLAIARRLPRQDVPHALSIAMELSDHTERTEALLGLAPLLTVDDQKVVLNELTKIRAEVSRAFALSRMMVHLPAGLQSECLKSASDLNAEVDLSSFLTRVAFCLPTTLLDQALTIARGIENVRLRAATMGRLALRLPSPGNLTAYAYLDEVPDDLTRLRAKTELARRVPADLGAELISHRYGEEGFKASRYVLLEVLHNIFKGEAEIETPLSSIRDTAALRGLSWSLPDERANAALKFLSLADDSLDSVLKSLPDEDRSSLLDIATGISARRYLTAFALLGFADSLMEDLHAEAIAAARSVEDRETRIRFLANLTRSLDEATSAEVIGEIIAEVASGLDENQQHGAAFALANALPPARRGIAWSKIAEIPDDAACAFFEDSLRRCWSQEAGESTGGGSPALGRSSVRLARTFQLDEQLPDELKELAQTAAKEIVAGGHPEQAYAALASALPDVWLRSMRGKTGKMSSSLSALADSLSAERSALIEISDATIDPKALAALRDARVALGNLLAIDEKTSVGFKATHALVARLPAQLHEEVVRKTLAASRSIGSNNVHAQAFVNLVRHVDTDLHVEAHKEALGRLQAIEERVYGEDGYEEILLELLCQETPEFVPPVLEVVRAEPDSWIRARILAFSAGVLSPQTYQLAAQILSEVDDNAIEMAMRVVPTLPDSLKPEALSRLRSVEGARNRAYLFSDLSICLPEILKHEAAQQAIEAARGIRDGSRAWTLAHLAASLPADTLPDVLSLARESGDAESTAASLGKIASFFPRREGAKVLREALAMLSEIPQSWVRASILEDVAPRLPKPLFEKAFAAARAIPDKTYCAKSLCRLAHCVSASSRDSIYDEAIAVVRQIDHDLGRAHGFTELAEILPPGRRDEAARDAWKILQYQPQDDRDGDVARDRAHILTRTIAYLPDDLVQHAVQETVNILNEMSEQDRGYLPQDLRRVLDARSQKESKSELKVPIKTKGGAVPQHRIQRDLLARVHIEHVRERSEPLKLGELHSLLEVIDSAGDLDDGDGLRHLVRLLPGEVYGDTLKELLGAAESVRWNWKRVPVYLDIAARLSGKEQGRVLCQAILSDNPAEAELVRFVENWRQDDYGPTAGLAQLDKLLSGLAKRTRPTLMSKVALLAPVLAHLSDRKINSDGFRAIRDVTRWWP